MTDHIHHWLPSGLRFRCACGVVGHLPAMLLGQRRTAATVIEPYLCQKNLAGRKHCGAEATYVTGERQKSRCAEHAPVRTRAA